MILKCRVHFLLTIYKKLAERDKQMSDMLELMITYDQKRKNLIADFKKKRLEAAKSGTEEELAEFDRAYKKKLDELDDSHIQELAAYKNLFQGIERLSDAAARKVIADARLMLTANTSLSNEERQKIQDAIKDAEEALDDRMPERLSQVSDTFAQMASSIGLVNEGLGTMLQGVSNVLRAVVQTKDGITGLKKGIENWQAHKAAEDKGGILGSISAVAGVAGPVGQIVGAVSSVVGGVVNFFRASRDSARQAAAEIKRYQDEIIAGELNYHRILRERARTGKNLADMTLSELDAHKKLLEVQLQSKELREYSVRNPNASIWDVFSGKDKKTVSEEMTEYDFNLARLQNQGLEITGKKTVKTGFLGLKKKNIDTTASLVGKTYDELEKLYEGKKLDEASRKLFEELRESKKERDEIEKTIREINDVIIADKMSGGLQASSISNPIIEGLRDGKRAIEDFAEFGEDIIRNALISAMAATVLEDPIKDLVAKFREDAKDGLSDDEINSFRQAYKEIVQSGIKGMEELQAATGIDFGKNDNKGMSGSIQSITQQQADVLAGQVGGIHLAVLRGQEISQKVYDVLNSQHSSFRDSIIYFKKIEENTAKTAINSEHLQRLERMDNSLDKIARSGNNSLRAGGN